MTSRLSFVWELEGWGPVSVVAYHFRAKGSHPRTLQVAVHGNTYDHRYWDAAVINGADYSYARYMTQRGYDVLAVDLPGTGESTRPPGDSVSLDWVGRNLAESIAAVRGAHASNEKRIQRVALVGHSLGTIVSVYTQARWRPADLLVATGTGYLPGRGTSSFAPGVREAALSRPYTTLPPDARAKAFYYEPTADPDVIAYDNQQLRGEMPRRLWTDCLAMHGDLAASGVRDVTCPVLIQLGEYDQVLLARYLEEEREQWTSADDVVLHQIDAVGHCFNLHRNREAGWRAIDAFLRERSS